MSTTLFEEMQPWQRFRMATMVLVAFKIPEELRDRVLATPQAKAHGIGQFMREAIAEKLGIEGRGLVDPPSRRGVGGRPTHDPNKRKASPDTSPEAIVRYDPPQPMGSALNSEVPPYRVAGKPVTDSMPGVSPETADRARGGALAAQRLARKEARPKGTAASPTESRSAPGPAAAPAKRRSPATPAPAQG